MSNDKAALFLTQWHRLIYNCPDPVAEYRFHPTRKWRFDFAWPDKKVSVEVDGGQFAPRGGWHMTDKDREKQNNAAVLGWRILHFSPQQLTNDPQTCISLVLEALK